MTRNYALVLLALLVLSSCSDEPTNTASSDRITTGLHKLTVTESCRRRPNNTIITKHSAAGVSPDTH
ncbi:MAG: hypothetical protein IPI24_00745 [Ignavibacteria bacterium]|nr:hypothetical protein [Ignavibacteria bacterium]